MKILKNTFWLTLSELGSRGIKFLAMVYLARILAKEAFGKIVFIQALTIYGMLLTDFGTPVLGMREVARKPEDVPQTIGRILCLRLVMGTLFLCICIILGITLFHDLELKYLMVFAAFQLIPYCLFVDWVFKGLEQMEYAAVFFMLYEGIALLLVSKYSLYHGVGLGV